MTDLRQMSPTESWLWALREASDENEGAVARVIASSALNVWRRFIAEERPAELRKRVIEGRSS